MTPFVTLPGKLWRDPERKHAETGKPNTEAVVRDGAGDNATWGQIQACGEKQAEKTLVARRRGSIEETAAQRPFDDEAAL